MKPAAFTATLVVLTLAPAFATAQSSSALRSAYATRVELEEQVAWLQELVEADSLSAGMRERRRGEAWLIQRRLDFGDFHAGDRILVTVRADSVLSDTLVVRAGSMVSLGSLPEFSLRGVLRAELEEHLRAEVGRYIREPEIGVVPLIRLAVMGEVRMPGFYSVPADVLVSDLVMIAGGPTATANLRKIAVHRDADQIWSPRDIEIALQDGMTLDQMSLRAGDQLTIDARPQRSLQTIFAVVSGITGIVYMALALLGN